MSDIHQMKQTGGAMVFCIFWASILFGLFIIQFFVGGGIPSGPDAENAPLAFVGLGILMAMISIGIRVMVLPRMKNLETLMAPYFIGLAIAESAAFFGIFLVGEKFPTSQLTLFIASVVCVILYVPIFLPKDEEKNDPRAAGNAEPNSPEF